MRDLESVSGVLVRRGVLKTFVLVLHSDMGSFICGMLHVEAFWLLYESLQIARVAHGGSAGRLINCRSSDNVMSSVAS